MSELKRQLYKCYSIINPDFFDDFEDNIDKRIAFQKYGLFFAFFFGLKIGDFSLYLHGPYNSELTDVGYEFSRNINYKDEILAINFAQPAKDIIDVIDSTLPIDNKEQVDLLEVYTTYFYLRNKRSFSKEDAINKLREIKKDLMGNNVEIYIQNILKLNSTNLE